MEARGFLNLALLSPLRLGWLWLYYIWMYKNTRKCPMVRKPMFSHEGSSGVQTGEWEPDVEVARRASCDL